MFNIKLELKIAKRKKTSSAEKSTIRFFFHHVRGYGTSQPCDTPSSFTIEFTNDKLSNKTEFF